MLASTRRKPLHGARARGEQVARSDGFEWFARAGFIARGLIYGIVGVLAVKVALGVGGKTTDQQGALRALVDGQLAKLA